MKKTLNNLVDVREVLRENDFKVIGNEEVIHVRILSNGPVATLHILDGIAGPVLDISYPVIPASNLLEDSEAAIALLVMNSKINPYAFAIHSDEEGEIDEDTSVVLTDRIPIGDLSEEEILHSINALLVALEMSKPILRAINQVEAIAV